MTLNLLPVCPPVQSTPIVAGIVNTIGPAQKPTARRNSHSLRVRRLPCTRQQLGALSGDGRVRAGARCLRYS